MTTFECIKKLNARDAGVDVRLVDYGMYYDESSTKAEPKGDLSVTGVKRDRSGGPWVNARRKMRTDPKCVLPKENQDGVLLKNPQMRRSDGWRGRIKSKFRNMI